MRKESYVCDICRHDIEYSKLHSCVFHIGHNSGAPYVFESKGEPMRDLLTTMQPLDMCEECYCHFSQGLRYFLADYMSKNKGE